MNDRMEQEIRRTILRLQGSMPEPRDRQTPVFTLLRIAASEMDWSLLLGLFAGALIFGLLSVRALSMPMLTIFCTAPMPMLLLFHRYVLACSERMRELEATFPYSYPEMLAARSVVISCCMFGALLLLSVTLHVSAGEAFLRLALCGAVPGIYLCALLLFLSASLRNPEGLSLLAVVFWAALCFLAALLPFDRLLQLCSTAAYAALAVIGLITVIVFGVRATENLIDNSKQKQEFEKIILPVLMFDPVPFEDPNEMGDLALLRSSIWAAILDNSDKYMIGDGNLVSVPQSDVDVACAKLFGSSVTLKHQAFEDYISMYSYDQETKTYYVPVDVTALYTPKVEEITRNGDSFELLVGYITPTNQWIQSLSGEVTEPTPSKYMIYVLQKVDDNYQLTGIKDPPDGVVPGVPQIEEDASQTAPATEQNQPQTIEPAQDTQPESTPSETEQPSTTESSQESA